MNGTIYPELRVGMQKVVLTNGETVLIYDTSGPYSDENATTDLAKGLPKVRDSSLLRDVKTQLSAAKAGIITPEMEYVAIRESMGVGSL